jgi:hypothetical protein
MCISCFSFYLLFPFSWSLTSKYVQLYTQRFWGLELKELKDVWPFVFDCHKRIQNIKVEKYASTDR